MKTTWFTGPLAFALLLVGTSCYLDPHYDPYWYWSPHDYNATPEVLDGEAGCYWDGAYGDYVWYFEAWVDDPDSVYDVTEVTAIVYDASPYAVAIQSFELYRTADPHVWFSDWLGSTTRLGCYYAGYDVDIIASDSYGWDDVLAVPVVTPGDGWGDPGPLGPGIAR